MSEPLTQLDFGGFNPRFPGITIKIESVAAFTLLQHLLSTQAVPQDEPNFSTVAIRSVLNHEVRHYHDFLISPHSAMIFRLRLQAAFNGIKVLNRIRNRSGSYLPVPLVRWVRLPEEERVQHAAEWCDLLGTADLERLGLVDLPYYEQDHFKAQPKPGLIPTDGLSDEEVLHQGIASVCGAYMKISEISAGVLNLPELEDFAPYTLYEQTALAAQVQSIWDEQGAEAAKVFLDELASSKLPYARVFRFVLKLANAVEKRVRDSGLSSTIPTLTQVAAISAWSLLGNYLIEGPSASPPARLIKLSYHLLSAASESDLATDVAATWDHWDRATASLPWRTSLSEMLKSNESVARQYEHLSTQEEGAELFARVMRRYVANQRLIVEHLLSEPGDLVDMNRYRHFPDTVLPLPLIRIVLSGIGLPLEALQNSMFEPIWAKKGEDNQGIVTGLVLRERAVDFKDNLDDALQIEILMNECDLVFSDHEIQSDIHMYFWRTVEKFLEKRLLFLV